MYVPDDLEAGDILLMVEGKGSLPARLLDRLIAWSTGNPFVHAALVGDGHLLDPLWRVERAPLGRYAANGWRFRAKAPEAVRKAAAAFAEGRVGNPYGLRELLADFARFDLHWVRPSWYRWRPQRWTCSGFVTAAYASEGLQLTLAPAPAPSDLSYSPLLTGPRPWDAPRHPRSRAAGGSAPIPQTSAAQPRLPTDGTRPSPSRNGR